MPIKRRLSPKTMKKARAGKHKKIKPTKTGFEKKTTGIFGAEKVKQWDAKGTRTVHSKTKTSKFNTPPKEVITFKKTRNFDPQGKIDSTVRELSRAKEYPLAKYAHYPTKSVISRRIVSSYPVRKAFRKLVAKKK